MALFSTKINTPSSPSTSLSSALAKAVAAAQPAPAPVQQTTPIAQVAQPQPAVNAANQQFLSQANKSYFTNYDPKTGLPVLNQKNLDDLLTKYKSNELTSGQYRDNYDKFGWNVKSDSSSVLNGAAIYGIAKHETGAGMSGSGGATYYKTGTTNTATDADFQQAANEAGVDISGFYKKGTLGSPGGLDKTAAYNAIQNATKDTYLVSNALDRTGVAANKAAPHASVLFKADGSGNLVPVTNANGDVAAKYYSGVGVTHEGWQGQLAELSPLIMAGTAFAAPYLSQALGLGETTALGSQIAGPAMSVDPALAGMGSAAASVAPESYAALTASGAPISAYSAFPAAVAGTTLAGIPANQIMASGAVPEAVTGAAYPATAGDVLAPAATAAGASKIADALNTASIVGGLGSLGQAAASYLGASAQSDAAKQAAANQLAMFNTINQQYAPQRGAGYSALNQIRSMLPGQQIAYNEQGQPIGTMTGNDYLTRQFTPQDLYAGLAPNYQWQLQQGQMANQRAANVGGGALSGNTLAGLERYTQDYAGNAYQQAFKNFQDQRTGIYNTLAGIAGLGQKAQDTTAQAGQAATTATGQLGVGSAAANAAGMTGAANAVAGGLQNYQQNQILQQILAQNQNVAQNQIS